MTNQLKKTINIILTGSTGMVGEGVLNECLQNGEVERVLVINRRSCGISHPKLKEIIHADFFNLGAIENQLVNYDACFFCLGISSVGMKETAYYQATYTLTMHVAETLAARNSGTTFCYISGSGTDTTENGKIMWARVKGKTENDLMKLPFKQVYNFRPGVLQPGKNAKNTLSFYKWLGWLIPIIKAIAPTYVCALSDLGTAMINAVTKGYEKQVLEVKDILALAKR